MQKKTFKFTFDIVWIRPENYFTRTGEPVDTVKQRIQDGSWAAGVHYKRTGPRTLWINLPEAQLWVQEQPHVEAYSPIKKTPHVTGLLQLSAAQD